MADTHIGYPGTVNSAQLASWMPNVAAAQYSVDGRNDGRVVSNLIGDRGVTVSKGLFIGDGIMDLFESDTNLNFASVASGDRWDMIVLRRTWNATPGASTSVFTIIQGGTNKSLPVRMNNKGVVADQPIALVRVRAGQTVVQEIVDLRTWASNGGVVAVDPLVMDYLNEPGTHLTLKTERGQQEWVRLLTPKPTETLEAWTRIDLGIQLFGASTETLTGLSGASGQNAQPLVDGNQPFFIQAGTNVNWSDASGYARLTFQRPFPNGLLTVLAFNGDDWSTGGSMTFASAGQRIPVFGESSFGGRRDWVYSVLGQPGAFLGGSSLQMQRMPNKQHRINWIAIGW